MKADVLSLDGKKARSIDLPEQFNEDYRPDLIKRAVLSLQAGRRQPYGAMEGAGMRYSSKLSRRRRAYKGSYGHGISRVPRKILWHRGTQFGWVGATAPGTVGGRRAHPPKAGKIWEQKINKKENKFALRSAISATALKELVKFDNIPIIIDNKFETFNKTKDVEDTLAKIGLSNLLERSKNKKIRAGRGKSRGRKYKISKGPLIVVGNNCNLLRAADNLPGLDIVNVNALNVELLAPGTNAGRVTVWTESAIEKLKNDKLFLNIKKAKAEKTEAKKEIKKPVKKEKK